MNAPGRPALAALGALARGALDLAMPPLCPLTGAPTARAGTLSADGWSRLAFVEDPVCRRCGAPFAFDPGAATDCAACLADPPAFEAARAAVVYDQAAQTLVLAFKHGDRTDLAPLLAGWLKRAGAGWWSAEAALVPVPLHWRRLVRRRYNQAALLARRLSAETGVPAIVDALVRIRATASQQGLSATARRRNLSGAIRPDPARPRALEGREAILVDDVLTTGATLSAAARAAKAAGATRVRALVLARALRQGEVIEGEA